MCKKKKGKETEKRTGGENETKERVRMLMMGGENTGEGKESG